MSAIAGITDFRQQAPPADIGVYAFPGEALVFKHVFAGTTYVCAVRPGDRGWILIDYQVSSAANDTVVIQSALDSLTAGRTWKETVILKGNYTTNTPLLIATYTIFRGGTITLADGADCNVIENSDRAGGNENIEIHHCDVNANWENQAASNNAITMYNVDELHIHHCRVRGGRRAGVYDLTRQSGEGIMAYSCHYVIIDDNFCYNAYYDDIKVMHTEHFIVSHNVCRGPSQASGAIQAAESPLWGIISDNTVVKTGAGQNIKLHGAQHVIVSNNSIRIGVYGIILIDLSHNNIIIGNSIYNPTTAGIFVGLDAVCNDNIIAKNHIWSYGGGHIGINVDFGTRTTIEGNRLNGNSAGNPLPDGIITTANAVGTDIVENRFVFVTTPITDGGAGTLINHNEGNVGHYQSADYGVAWANWVANIAGTATNGTRCIFHNTNDDTYRLGCYANGAWRFVTLT